MAYDNEKATDEGMPEYEADASRVENAGQPGGGVLREEAGQPMFRTQAEQPETQEDLEAVDLSEHDEDEEVETYPNGKRVVYFQYVGKRDENVTRYGTHRKGETYKLPENKALTVLEMKQPDNSPAYEEV
jgi:hypothetical protein